MGDKIDGDGGWQLSRVVADEEIGNRVLLQAMSLQPDTYLGKEKAGLLLEKLLEVAKKLERVKYHLGRCKEMVAEAIAEAEDVGGIATHSDQTTGIEAEVEAFLMQGKSCLDLLVKILAPIASINAATFGDKGNKLIEALENNVPAKKQDRAVHLVNLVKNDQEWLEPFIDERDTVAHFKALWSTGLRVTNRDGQRFVDEPRDRDGASFRQKLKVLYFNLLTFTEDFVALAIHLGMPGGLTIDCGGA